jgi:hypothetical protein
MDVIKTDFISLVPINKYVLQHNNYFALFENCLSPTPPAGEFC